MTRRTHALRVRAAVPGILPRLLFLALATVGVFALNPYPLWQVVAIVAALVSVVIPHSLVAWVAIACLPLGMLLSEPSIGRTALALLLVHALHVLAVLSLTIPATSRVAPGAMLPTARRFAIVQVIAQPLVLALQLLASGLGGASIGWAAPIAAVALVGGVLLVLRVSRR